MPLLSLERCTKRCGGLVANADVSLTIEEREIVGLIGPNGAGKTTLFNCISGHHHPDEGRVLLGDHDITRTRPDRVCRLGIARTWQIVRAFGRMTALDNVMCGAFQRTSRIGEARARAQRLLHFAGPGGKRTCGRPTSRWPTRSGWRSPAPWPPSRARCCSTRRCRG